MRRYATVFLKAALPTPATPSAPRPRWCRKPASSSPRSPPSATRLAGGWRRLGDPVAPVEVSASLRSGALTAAYASGFFCSSPAIEDRIDVSACMFFMR